MITYELRLHSMILLHRCQEITWIIKTKMNFLDAKIIYTLQDCLNEYRKLNLKALPHQDQS